MEIIRELDWSPLFITLKTAVVAIVFIFLGGIFVAAKISKRHRRCRAFFDGLLALPMILPPTVVGFFLLIIFSLRRPFGMFLYTHMGIKVVQSWYGCVIAAVIVSFPLMYRSARAAFDQVDVNLIYAGQTLGMKESEIFWRIVMPAARPGIVSGTVLAFARALGEYGATSMLAGNIAGKTGTIAQVIAMVLKDGDYAKAWVWVIIMMVIAMIILVVMNSFAGQKGRKR